METHTPSGQDRPSEPAPALSPLNEIEPMSESDRILLHALFARAHKIQQEQQKLAHRELAQDLLSGVAVKEFAVMKK